MALIDGLYLAFRGEIDDDARARLREAMNEAARAKSATAVEIGPCSFELNPRSHDGWWRLGNRDVAIVIDEDASKGWRLEIRATATFLLAAHPRGAVAHARELATAILKSVEEERVRRVDPAVDVAGLDLTLIEPHAWIAPPRSTVSAIDDITSHAKAGQRLGFAIGRGGVRLRVYNKVEELKLSRNDGAKREETQRRWLAAGWDGSECVTRCEAQLRSDALKEIAGGRFRSPDELLDGIDELWAYCTRKWIKLTIPTTSNRRDRWPVHPWWETVRGAVFVREVEEIPSRIRCRGMAGAQLATALALAHAAGRGVLTPFDEAEFAALDALSEERASETLRARLSAAMKLASRACHREWIDAFGAKVALRHFMDKNNAVCARASSMVELSGAELLSAIDASE